VPACHREYYMHPWHIKTKNQTLSEKTKWIFYNKILEKHLDNTSLSLHKYVHTWTTMCNKITRNMVKEQTISIYLKFSFSIIKSRYYKPIQREELLQTTESNSKPILLTELAPKWFHFPFSFNTNRKFQPIYTIHRASINILRKL